MSISEDSRPPASPMGPDEREDWLESLNDVLELDGPLGVRELLRELQVHSQQAGVELPVTSQTPYVNTIPHTEQPAYPGDRALERRIKSLIRWNAMAMVVRANRTESGIGGHISTYASSATLLEVGFNHFFRGKDHPSGGDHLYFQGHASPGIYSRAFLEGRLDAQRLQDFRRELMPSGGLSSYPHPWLMPDFWEFPTVSMGLGPITAIYRARFQKYLENRGLIEPSDAKVWCFIGDGESDEPETLGAISLASRERLDNLIFVINCNLQRLDGPVRGNGKIVQELEAVFRGVGWNVIKVLWGNDWDPILSADTQGLMQRRVMEIVDGEYQKYRVEGGAYTREHFFGAEPELAKLVEHLSDSEIERLRIGGHDPVKVHAAYKAAVEHQGRPTVILAKTIKGYGLGEAGEGKNITHQQKKLNEEELLRFRDRFDIPLTDDQVRELPFYHPGDDSEEVRYLQERRAALGGYVPTRRTVSTPLPLADEKAFTEFADGTGERAVSTTMVCVKILSNLLKDAELQRHLVPIVPDEARTFGMEPLFRQIGIYSSVGQLYEPVDRASLLYYKEARDGQILEEGITEAGSMSSFLAAGTAHANHGIPMIPVFLFYSMFGMQRIGDLVWSAGDSRCRGFLVGATAGRTTLAGEGLQHQDGHSHLLAYPVPNLVAYDPAYAYELAVIMKDGLRRMYHENEDVFYYVTVGNENYAQPAMPEGAEEGILRGLYRFRAAEGEGPRVQLLGAGAILNEAVAAADLLAEEYGVQADVWSVTSFKELHTDAQSCERHNRLEPGAAPRLSWIEQCFEGVDGPFVAASDYMQTLPDSLARWIPGKLTSLGTDGFGRSEGRASLRDFFEVDAAHIAHAALVSLAREGAIDADVATRAMGELGVSSGRPDPWTV